MSAIIGQCPVEYANAAIDKIAQARPEDFGLSSFEFPDGSFKKELAQGLCNLANGCQPLLWCGDALCKLGLIRSSQIKFSDGTPPEKRYAIQFDNHRQALWSLGADGLLKLMTSEIEVNAD